MSDYDAEYSSLEDFFRMADNVISASEQRRCDEAGKNAANALWSAYDQMIHAGFTPPQAMDLLKTLIACSMVGGHK